MTSSTSSSPAVVARARRGRRNRPRRRREVSAAAARSKGPHRRARGGIGPSLRDDVAVTFIVDRTLLDDDEEGERAVWACGNVEALGRWGAATRRATGKGGPRSARVHDSVREGGGD